MFHNFTRLALIAGLIAGLAAAGALQARADAPRARPAPRATGQTAPAPRGPWPVGRDNVVASEMRALTGAMDTVVRAIANNDLQAIPPAIHAVHTAREKTDAAIHAGAYRPPSNGDRLEAFVALDEAFHDELVALVRAARAGDLAAATRQVGPIMNGCTGCHQQFRR